MARKGLASRRHHAQRMKAKVSRPVVRKYYGVWDPNDRKRVGQAAQTRQPCSCHMCGNPRKRAKDCLTLQEKKANDSWNNQKGLE